MRLGRVSDAEALCIEMIRHYPRDRDAISLRKQIKLGASR